MELLDTEEAERRFALYQKQTETHLRQERLKYKGILDQNDELNKLVDRLTAERAASEANARKTEAKLRQAELQLEETKLKLDQAT